MKDIKITQSITKRECDSITSYFKDIYKLKPLTQEEEIELAKEGSQASLNKLVEHNLRFVISVAKQYQGQGLPLEDLISFGNIGLIEASKRFDPDKKFKFISYAVWWIKQSILQAIYNNNKTIKTPTSFIVTYQRLNRIISDFVEANGYEPSYSDLEELTDIPEEKISEILSQNIKCVSLDTPISNDFEESSLVDVVENTNSESPDLQVSNDIKHQQLKLIISKLSERESYVLINHFGLFGANPKNFEEIGKDLGLTGERVRQIKNDGIRKLRSRFGVNLKNILS